MLLTYSENVKINLLFFLLSSDCVCVNKLALISSPGLIKVTVLCCSNLIHNKQENKELLIGTYRNSVCMFVRQQRGRASVDVWSCVDVFSSV